MGHSQYQLFHAAHPKATFPQLLWKHSDFRRTGSVTRFNNGKCHAAAEREYRGALGILNFLKQFFFSNLGPYANRWSL